MDYKELFKDVQCVTCFDKFVLVYLVEDCLVQCEKTSEEISVSVKYLSLNDEEQRKGWYKKNIFNLPLYQAFIIDC